MNEKQLLIIEDEKPIAEILSYGFKKEGFSVRCAYTGAGGLSSAMEIHPDLVLLDWMLPDLSGVDVCRILTERFNIPIIMLTARSSMEDKLYGLETGADDYITKPFDLREVIARAKTILRRYEKAGTQPGNDSPDLIRSGHLVISRAEWTVEKDGIRIDLTPREFELLLFLAGNPRQVFTRAQLLDRIWGYDFEGDTRTVDIHIQRLRKKLDLTNSLITVFGVGYKYEPQKEN
ncbi:MAG: response regulator transcription factor [Fusicatenibacter sp.]|nr:response regulator transcription factor [Lachnospiraceae bacterium]MDY2937936.1 response regulator transcription factor [Fusicatenibacter sp.]